MGDTERYSQTKKKKYINLYSQEAQNRDIVLLKGRHKCQCQASKHKLINNCLKCGRIVCEQEGSGPCLFCGNLVCSREEQEFLSSGTKQSSQLLQKLMDRKPAGYEIAVEQRNRLLEYDRTRYLSSLIPSSKIQLFENSHIEKRTQVIDDESDYFSVNSVWLSPAERERLRQKEEELQVRKHQSRRNRKVALDLGLRKMVESKPEDEDPFEMDELLRDITNSMSFSSKGCYEGENADPSIGIQLKYDDGVMYDQERNHSGSQFNSKTSQNKVQDREYLEMVDQGLCISLHQPWASLLVSGIKMHEGRNWYTSHRGRLWIASASKTPTEQEVQDAESVYRSITKVKRFPSSYPTGCLLGCVNVFNCLPQEEYRKQYPDGESLSPFVFICDSPQELPVRFPIMGKHKIYKLDTSIHQAAQKALQRLAKIKSDKNS